MRHLNFLTSSSARSTVAGMALVMTPLLFGASSAQAAMSESLVQQYADNMRQHANSQNIQSIANLIADDALISLSRRGRTTSLDKSAYLNLLQDSWSQTNNYRYTIQINNVVITSPNQARADVQTTESWVRDGNPITMTTNARATLSLDQNQAVLVRSVAQVTID